MISRHVELGAGRTVRQITRYARPPHRERSRVLEEAAWRRLERLGRQLLQAPQPPAEQPVPDGMACEIEVADAARSRTVRVAVPTARQDLRPLVETLAALLPPP